MHVLQAVDQEDDAIVQNLLANNEERGKWYNLVRHIFLLNMSNALPYNNVQRTFVEAALNKSKKVNQAVNQAFFLLFNQTPLSYMFYSTVFIGNTVIHKMNRFPESLHFSL
jgi:hypothetical protein